MNTATPAHTVSIPARRARAMAGTVAAKAKASKTPLLDALAKTKPVKAIAAASELEEKLVLEIRGCTGLPAPEREYRFHPVRRWRFDLAWPARHVAVECEGATWANGRHTRGSGYEADTEKYNEAAIAGWLVLRCTRAMIEDGRALRWIVRALT